MSVLILSSIAYSGYISPVKLVVFLLMLFVWLALTDWVYKDNSEIESGRIFWPAVVFGVGAATLMLWFFASLFIIGLTIHLIAVVITAISYVKYRNSTVLEYDRILTVEHFRSMFSSKEQDKLDSLKNFLFITANGNDITMPQPKTPEFAGYRAAYDIFNDAIDRRAEKITFSPGNQEYKIVYSVDGVSSSRPAIPWEHVQHFIKFIKSLADVVVEEKRKPQKGTFKIRRDKEKFEWELVIAGSTAGERLQCKLISQSEATRVAEIGLREDQLTELNEIRDVAQGLFIVAGSKKSGATTTFYALLRNHDAFLNSIETLETAPSSDVSNINQHTFSLSDTGTTTFAKKLLGVIRMGPDIIGVAGCTDSESARIVCNAAKDGKIIYITLEADDIKQALTKWIKLVGNKEHALETLIGISSQRVLRKLCEECKHGYSPNTDVLRRFNLPADKVKVLYRPGKVIYDKRGKEMTCEACHGIGFVGRTGVFETIVINEQLRKKIIPLKSISEIITEFRHAKMRYLQERALALVIRGTTSIDEMLRVFSANEKNRVKKRVSQKPAPKKQQENS